MLDETNSRSSACIRCNTCNGHPCLLHAKSNAQVLAAGPVLRHSNVSLITRVHVERRETSPSGHEVASVTVKQKGSQEEYAAGLSWLRGDG
jgi:hypothetical protein